MGRKKVGAVNPPAVLDYKYELESLESVFPALTKAINADEIRLLDLSSIQMELERVLANIVEYLECINAEYKGKDLPPNILSAIKRRQSILDCDGAQQSSRSLIVKANPDKPLTLIISQRMRPNQTQSTLPFAPVSTIQRTKGLTDAVCGRRSSRSSIEEHAVDLNRSPSPDKNPAASSYAIPNKFWELMEPYCAEITEANVSYLESLIRSYQDMESTFFQLPPLKLNEIQKVEVLEAPAIKRLRRDSTHANHNSASVSQSTSDDSTAFATASNMVALAKCLETELKRPISDSSMLGQVAHSLLDSYYQDNVISDFNSRLDSFINKYCSSGLDLKASVSEEPDLKDGTDSPASDGRAEMELTRLGSPQPSTQSNDAPVIPDSSTSRITEVKHSITSNASQSIKSLAKHLHVSSSYRVEKKIMQAIDELGLFPLGVVHPSNTQQLANLSNEKCSASDRLLSSTLSVQPVIEPGHPSTKLVIRTSGVRTTPASLKTSPVHAPATSSSSPTDKSPPDKRRRTLHNKTSSPLVNCEIHHKEPNAREHRTLESDELNTNIKSTVETDSSNKPRCRLIWRAKKSNRNDFKKLKSLRYRNKLRNSLVRPTTVRCNGYSQSPDDSVTDKYSNSAPIFESEKPLENGILTTDDDEDEDEEENDNDFGHQQFIHSNHTNESGDRKRHTSSAITNSTNNRKLNGETHSHSNLSNSRHTHQSPGIVSCLQDEQPHLKHNSPTEMSHKSPQLSSGGDHTQDEHTKYDQSPLGEVRTSQLPNGSDSAHSRLSFLTLRSSNMDNPESLDPKQAPSPWLKSVPSLKCDTNPSMDSLDGKRLETNIRSLFEGIPVDGSSTQCLLSNPLKHSPSIHTSDPDSTALTAAACGLGGDEIGWAIVQRQQELRRICASNHTVLKRLLQAARRDMQRQEIQRRLAIADADVIEAYNKLESYRPQRKPPLKRDRDLAWKTLKERRKIVKELEAFDSKSP